jgi:type IV pilus assembly protein PilA
MKSTRGFSLIELMVVVAIIAILASLSMSIYLDSISKSQLSEAFTVSDGIKTDVNDYFLQTGICPTLGKAPGFPSAPSSYGGKYVASVDIINGGNSNCVLQIAMRGTGSVTPRLIGKTVTLTMTTASSTLSIWSCSSSADAKYLPQTCR